MSENYKAVDENGNVCISMRNTLELLQTSEDEKINKYVLAIYDWLEDIDAKNKELEAQNNELRNTIDTLKEVIKALTQQCKN